METKATLSKVPAPWRSGTKVVMKEGSDGLVAGKSRELSLRGRSEFGGGCNRKTWGSSQDGEQAGDKRAGLLPRSGLGKAQ